MRPAARGCPASSRGKPMFARPRHHRSHRPDAARHDLGLPQAPARHLAAQARRQGHRHARGRASSRSSTASTASSSRTTAGAPRTAAARRSTASPKWRRRSNGRVPVIVDGGFRRGSDVFKALALGANAVGIGRPYIWGLASFGQEGVERVLEILRAELAGHHAPGGNAQRSPRSTRHSSSTDGGHEPCVRAISHADRLAAR